MKIRFLPVPAPLVKQACYKCNPVRWCEEHPSGPHTKKEN